MIDTRSVFFVTVAALTGLSGCSWFDSTSAVGRALTYAPLSEAEADQGSRLEASQEDAVAPVTSTAQSKAAARSDVAALTTPVEGSGAEMPVEETYEPDVNDPSDAAIHITLPDVSLNEKGSGATVHSPGDLLGGGPTGGKVLLNPKGWSARVVR